ncbi:hypothetical protein ACFVY4_19410 [Streptomyces sp. NPDC058299]
MTWAASRGCYERVLDAAPMAMAAVAAPATGRLYDRLGPRVSLPVPR